jgi:hypothetical protein
MRREDGPLRGYTRLRLRFPTRAGYRWLSARHTPESAVAPAPPVGSRAVSTHRILEHVEGVYAGTKESIIAVCRAARAEIVQPRERVPREVSFAREGSRVRATVSTAREGDTGDRGGTTTTSVVALAPMAPPTDPPLVTTGPTRFIERTSASALVRGWRSSCVPNGPPRVARLLSRRILMRDACDRQPARAQPGRDRTRATGGATRGNGKRVRQRTLRQGSLGTRDLLSAPVCASCLPLGRARRLRMT